MRTHYRSVSADSTPTLARVSFPCDGDSLTKAGQLWKMCCGCLVFVRLFHPVRLVLKNRRGGVDSDYRPSHRIQSVRALKCGHMLPLFSLRRVLSSHRYKNEPLNNKQKQ